MDDFDRVEAFLLVRRGDCFSPKSLFDSLGVYTKDPLIVFLRDFIAKAYWGLNKPVGIFAVLSMHPARSARLPYTLHNDKEPFKRSNPTRGFDEKTVSLVTRFRRV